MDPASLAEDSLKRHMRIYKKPRPFNHIFGGDRILRAWYRGIKNAGPRRRAQGRAQEIPYQSISPYHHGIWRIFVECGKKKPTRARARKGEAQGVLSYQKATGIFDNPHIRKVRRGYLADVSDRIMRTLQKKVSSLFGRRLDSLTTTPISLLTKHKAFAATRASKLQAKPAREGRHFAANCHPCWIPRSRL